MVKYEFKEVEESILEFWKDKKIHEKAAKKGKENFYFLDGPPYTSGEVHIGTAWNKCLKDAILRYKRMAGFKVWDRAGYDMHGLPTELKVQKKLGLKSKDDIPKFGVDKFIEECKKFAVSNLLKMNKDFKRLGVWMDFENAYQTISSDWMEGEWWLIKKAEENKRLYEGEKVMHWCGSCATSLAKHELEYKNVKENSIFLKFKTKDNEFLIIWTTTPWTIPFNLGVMVNPTLDYVKAKVDDEVWIVAKALVGGFIQGVLEKKFEIIEEFKGIRLKGLEYEHPLKDIIDYSKLKKKHKNIHTVVLSEEYVDTSAGSGLVHMSPGSGPEDQIVGQRNNIPPFNTLDEYGVFTGDLGPFKGMVAKKDDKKIIEELKKTGNLVAVTLVEHDYAHCWRCSNPVIYRPTRQWFFRVEDMREGMRKLNKKILWVPEWAGSKQFDSWLDNLRDNGITRQRYWGTPLPIWRCACGKYEVIGSVKELKKKSKVPEDLHKPWIDEVKWKCECGGDFERIPDILDVWIDAGSASWNCLGFPQNEKNFKLFPADFILEGNDQIRGWFNLLFVASMVSMYKPSFKACYMHGFVNDALGRKMSKSAGNTISPYEIIDKYGADPFRLYTIGNNAGLDLNYNQEDIRTKQRNIVVLWNVHNYLLGMDGKKKVKHDIEELYILSKLNSVIKKCTEHFDKYEIDKVPNLVEDLFLELSRTYIQLTRTKDKEIVFATLYHVYLEVLKLAAPIIPFVSEAIYQNLKEKFKLKEESIHHFKWPSFDKKLINPELEEQVKIAKEIIQAVLSGREKIQRGVRWPLRRIIVVSSNKHVRATAQELDELIKVQTNVKDVLVKSKMDGIEVNVKIDYGRAKDDFKDNIQKVIAHVGSVSGQTVLDAIESDGKYSFKHEGEGFSVVKEHLIVERKVPDKFREVAFGDYFVYLDREVDDKLECEGYARELMRRVQMLRKKFGLNKKDRISLFLKVVDEHLEGISEWEEQIKEKVGASLIKIAEIGPTKTYEFYNEEEIRGDMFGIWFDKE